MLASEIAVLGARTVGSIIPAGGPRHRATWIVKLPDWHQAQGPSSSFEAARRKVEHEVNEWLRSAGLLDAGGGVVVRIEEEGSAASARIGNVMGEIR
jgi:hypothetical protein